MISIPGRVIFDVGQKEITMWKCKHCNSEIDDDTSITCWNCGTDTEPSHRNLYTKKSDKGKNKCQFCGSKKIISGVQIADNTSSSKLIKLYLPDTESTILQTPYDIGSMNASICCDCGNIKLCFVGDLKKIWKTYGNE
jgi:hypothetical protein